MRAVFLFAGVLLISTGCVSEEATTPEVEIVINNGTDYPAPPEVTTLSQDTTTESNYTTDLPPTTTAKPTTPTTVAPPPTPPKPTEKPITTEVPHTTTAEPAKERHFDGASFLGGIILAVGLMAIGLVILKFYKARAERNYHTL